MRYPHPLYLYPPLEVQCRHRWRRQVKEELLRYLHLLESLVPSPGSVGPVTTVPGTDVPGFSGPGVTGFSGSGVTPVVGVPGL